MLEIVEGRATLSAPNAMDERILQSKKESTQKIERKSERTKVEKSRRGERAKDKREGP